jgi:hypothetical protein
VRGLVEGAGVPVWSWVATWARRSRRACARPAPARGGGRGGHGTGERGPWDSDTVARAHDGPKRRHGDPTEQREGERRGSAPTGRVRVSETEGTRARLGLVGRLGRNGFSIFQGFSNCFSIYFL